MDDAEAPVMKKLLGSCANCGDPVWSDQESISFEGIVRIHEGCWDEGNDAE